MADEQTTNPIPDEEEEDEEYTPTPERHFGNAGTATGTVHVETGRGQTAEVAVGSPFHSTIERIAEEAHYGGYFRVFLNGEELLNPEEAPANVEAGMRIALTSFDKVG